MQVRVHPRVKKYLDESGDKQRQKDGLARLGDDPFTSRSGVDIKKLKGKTHEICRLRSGENWFEYFVEDGIGSRTVSHAAGVHGGQIASAGRQSLGSSSGDWLTVFFTLLWI